MQLLQAISSFLPEMKRPDEGNQVDNQNLLEARETLKGLSEKLRNQRKRAYHQRNTLIKEQTPKNKGSGSIPFIASKRYARASFEEAS